MKKLLLIGLDYHNYTHAIADEFRALGFFVVTHEIQPRSLSYKVARRIFPSLYDKMIFRHHKRIVTTEIGNTYDFVVFIQVHQFNVRHLEEFRKQHYSAKFILYNWDSLHTHDYRPQMHVFDRIFTFDADDAKSLGVDYLPLFCIRSFQALRNVTPSENAIYFVGNVVNSRRYLAVEAFRKYCLSHNIPFYAYLACTPYIYLKMLRLGIYPKNVSIGHIKEKQFIDFIQRSNTVFDFANHQQSGYTMRVIENLCMNKRLITNNARILEEDFYSPSLIYIYRDFDFSGVAEFMKDGRVDAGSTFDRFYIQEFVQKLIESKDCFHPEAGPIGTR